MLRSANNGVHLRRGAAATRHGASTESRSRWLHFVRNWEGGLGLGSCQCRAVPHEWHGGVDACKSRERVVERRDLG